MRRTLPTAVTALVALAVVAPPASAAQVPLSGGATVVRLDPGTTSALRSLGIRVGVSGRAKATRAGVAFPITDGRIDPVTAGGVYRHAGSLSFRRGRTRVDLSSLTLAVDDSPTLSADVDGRRFGVAAPDLKRAQVLEDAATTTVGPVALTLTGRLAGVLDRALKVRVFRAGTKLGTAGVTAVKSELVFSGGRTDLSVDPAAAAELTSLGITPGLSGAAVTNDDGSLGFPITYGRVGTQTLAGSLVHAGGLTLTRGATVVTLQDFAVDTTAQTLSATVDGSATQVPILALDETTAKVDTIGRQVTIQPVPAKLTQAGADALNAAFATTQSRRASSSAAWRSAARSSRCGCVPGLAR